MKNTRILTGNWYLHKKWFGYDVIVETIQTSISNYDSHISPEFTIWERAKRKDLIKLNIKIA